MRECKGICNSFDRISFRFGGKIYKNIIKFCCMCGIFMKNSGYRCSCCKTNLRSNSHNKKWRIKCQN